MLVQNSCIAKKKVFVETAKVIYMGLATLNRRHPLFMEEFSCVNDCNVDASKVFAGGKGGYDVEEPGLGSK